MRTGMRTWLSVLICLVTDRRGMTRLEWGLVLAIILITVWGCWVMAHDAADPRYYR